MNLRNNLKMIGVEPEPKRVAVVHGHAHHVFGSERVTFELCALLREAGHLAEIYLPTEGPFFDLLQTHGHRPRTVELQRKRLPTMAWRRRTPSMALTLEEHGIDLVHCTSISPLAVTLSAARKLEIPIVAQVQTHYDPIELRRSGAASVDLLLPVSHSIGRHTADHLACLNPTIDQRIRCVHPPVVLPVSKVSHEVKNPRETYGVAPESPLIGMLGQVIPRKGVDLFLRAIAALPTSETPATAWIIGGSEGDPYRVEMERLARALGIGSRVRFIESVPDVRPFMKELDVLAVPSRKEGLGLVAGEAFLAGTAVVASRTGGLVEVVHDGITGVLCEVDDASSLCDSIQRLLSNPVQAARMTENGARLIQKCFSRQVFLRGILNAHRWVDLQSEAVKRV